MALAYKRTKIKGTPSFRITETPQQSLIPSYHGVHKMKALGGGGVILGTDLDFDPLAIIGGMHCREGLLQAQGPCRPLGHTK